MSWIVIPNWDRFQHYGNRQPPWIKLYPALLTDSDFQGLSPANRSALVSIWMLYAITRRRVHADPANLTRATGQHITKGTLASLNRAGFLAFSAVEPPVEKTGVLQTTHKPATNHAQTSGSATSRNHAGLRANLASNLLALEVEVDKDLKPLHEKGKSICPTCGIKPRNLAEHAYHQHGGPEPAHWLEAEARHADQ